MNFFITFSFFTRFLAIRVPARVAPPFTTNLVAVEEGHKTAELGRASGHILRTSAGLAGALTLVFGVSSGVAEVGRKY
jgi:hypothetical protein